MSKYKTKKYISNGQVIDTRAIEEQKIYNIELILAAIGVEVKELEEAVRDIVEGKKDEEVQ